MVITRKIEIYVHEEDKELKKNFQHTLYEWRDAVRRAANLIVSHKFVQQNVRDFMYLQEERPKAFNLQGIPSNYVPSSGGELYIVIPDSEESVLETTLASMLDYAKNHAKPDADVVSIFKDRIIECVALEKSTLDESTSADNASKRTIHGLWRDASEEPEAGRELITLSSKGIKVYPNPKNNRMAWPFFTRISRITSWFYSDELLPVEKKQTS